MNNLQKIQKVYFKILENLNKDQWNLLVNDEWTIKDCVAHFLAWEKLAVDNLDNRFGNSFTMNFNDYEKFNVIAINKYKNYSTDRLLNEWKKYQHILSDKVGKLSKEQLEHFTNIFDWIGNNSNNHYTYHLKQINKVLSP